MLLLSYIFAKYDRQRQVCKHYLAEKYC